MKRPFAIMLGGRHPKANIELHDLVFVLANDSTEAFKEAKKKWFGDPKKVHGDGYVDLLSLEGFDYIGTENSHVSDSEAETNQNKKLFAINIGGYLQNEFGEFHHYHFVVANDGKEAIKKAREAANPSFLVPHVDDKLEVDDLIEVNQIDGHQLVWRENPNASKSVSESGYFPFRSN